MTTDWNNWIGRSQTTEDILTEQLILRYEATIGKASPGSGAPLGIHWCLGTPTTALKDLGGDGHPKKGNFLPPVNLPRRMWASSKVSFLAPLKVGKTVQRISTIESIQPKRGSSGDLVFVNITHETISGDQICLRETQTVVYRDSAEKIMPMPATTGFTSNSAEQVEVIKPDPQLLFRYSALTFNTHRIHYDPDYASEECYPALVVHGPLMACLLLRLASDKVGSDHIKTFEFRVRSPAFCGQDIFLCLGFPEDENGMEIRGGDGRLIMSASINS